MSKERHWPSKLLCDKPDQLGGPSQVIGKSGGIVAMPPTSARNEQETSDGLGGNAGGNIPANLQGYGESPNAKIPTNMLRDGSKFVGILDGVPPQGLEYSNKSQEKHGQTIDGGSAGDNERQDLDELVELWSTLPTSTRNRCLAWLRSQAVQVGIRDAWDAR